MSDEGITGDVCEGRLYNIMQEKHAMDIIIFLYRTGGAKEIEVRDMLGNYNIANRRLTMLEDFGLAECIVPDARVKGRKARRWQLTDKGTAVAHLTYVGDSDIGKNVNFGCGTVTVNYDGTNKAKCVVKDNAFIGCNTNLIAPVTIGEAAYTAAGSTVTKDIPDGALAIERSDLHVINGYAVKKLTRHLEKGKKLMGK